MTRKQKAVAVANDVLSLLRKRNNTIQVKSGYCYLDAGYCPSPEQCEGDLRNILPEVLKSGCTVCALGAALISKVRLYDKVPLREVLGISNRILLDQITATQLLEDVFSKTTLNLMEAAFELSFTLPSQRNPKVYGAICFGAKHKDPKRRLIAIMKNIIDNDGEFVVVPATKVDAVQAKESV